MTTYKVIDHNGQAAYYKTLSMLGSPVSRNSVFESLVMPANGIMLPDGSHLKQVKVYKVPA